MRFRQFCLAAASAVGLVAADSQFSPNLVADGIPAIPEDVRQSASRYLDFRTAAFQGWHPNERRMLITTRFGDSPQLHEVAMPGGARRQLTFLPEPVSSASYQPESGKYIIYSQDIG